VTNEQSPYFRGRGVFVVSGAELRIRGLRIAINADGSVELPPPTLELRAEMWPHWLASAESSSEAARIAMEDTRGTDDPAFARAVEREFRASLLALTAAAFSLDAFYASVVARAPPARVVAKGRAASVCATFARAFVMTNAQQQTARKALGQIFGFRNLAVHPPADFSEIVTHPVYGLGMERRFVIFRLENAVTSRGVAHRLIWLCLHRARRKYPELVAWADKATSMIDAPGTSAALVARPDRLRGAVEEGVELGRRAASPARHGLGVHVERGPHVGVAHRGLSLLGREAGRGEVRRRAVARLVRRQRLQLAAFHALRA
jgi:hypothetical protein